MIEIEKPRIECVEQSDDNTYGKFVVEPLERGYGVTLGNSLRRILLSSIPGAAVTSIKIDGVLHEFSTVPGVKEDVAEIILNIKSLALKSSSDEPQIIIIDATEEGEVTAGDIITTDAVEVLNKDLHIATLDTNSRLYIEMVVETGRGYVSADKNKKDGLPIGTIPVLATILSTISSSWTFPATATSSLPMHCPWQRASSSIICSSSLGSMTICATCRL